MSGALSLAAEPLRNNKGLVLGTAAWVGLLCLLGVVLMSAPRPASQRALQDTAQLERFGTLLSHAKAIPPSTAREVEQLMRISYDCEKAQCKPAIANRNRVARLRLRDVLTAATLPDPDKPVGMTAGRLHAFPVN